MPASAFLDPPEAVSSCLVGVLASRYLWECRVERTWVCVLGGAVWPCLRWAWPVVRRLGHSATRCPQELALSTLMKFVQLEGAHPLEKPKWDGYYLFPRQLFKVGCTGVGGQSLRPELGWALAQVASECRAFAVPSPAGGVRLPARWSPWAVPWSWG